MSSERNEIRTSRREARAEKMDSEKITEMGNCFTRGGREVREFGANPGILKWHKS